MDDIKNLKNQQINNFMSSFEDLRIISVDQIEEGLKYILGERPAIDFIYGVDFSLNETTGDDDRIKSLKKINILYSYIDTENNPKIGKMSYIVG